ncbi:MAG: sigma-54-dependent Fis family transcriptional regulator [Desulfuromonadales bacterium]|nr:sigma-54-dependent Fis family transcriptional regulator [Desulfuromonadales bacterium]
MKSSARVQDYLQRITSYGKENLADILHEIGEAVPLITRQYRFRLYLEDLTGGILNCVLATGRPRQAVHNHVFSLTDENYLVSRVYIEQQDAEFADRERLPSHARLLAEDFGLMASTQLPLVHKGRSIGVICVDSSRAGNILNDKSRQALRDFLALVAPVLDQARKYHQQIIVARRIDESKKKEAARTMVRSAVRLIDKLSLASVLVPSRVGGEGGEGHGLQVLASYAQDREIQRLYEDEKLIDLSSGKSLFSQYINEEGVITDETLLRPLYFPSLKAQSLQKSYLTDKIGLTSLYVVPCYDNRTRRITCLVNYFTQEPYRFSDFERGLLEAHAEMAERVIQEIGDEHMEIQVLSEINDLLQERIEGSQPFLNRVLAKATELIGADTGSIALVQERDGDAWLIVEEEDGTLIGAKSKEWLKKNIPRMPIGGTELPRTERSLTGYVASSRQPLIVDDSFLEMIGEGFYRQVTQEIRSEIAVPVTVEEKVLAVVCLSSLTSHYFTYEHQRILQIIVQMIARHLAGLLQIERLTTEVQHLQTDVTYRDPKISSYRLGNIIGNSSKAEALVSTIETLAPPLFRRILTWQQADLREATLGLPTVLITGDTGSGKEFLFNNIYTRLNEMYRATAGMVGELPVTKTNIAAYSGELTYSELFGHKRGAFTGAHVDRHGIIEEASGGVVFLDEIGDADPKTQVQLLRFLDNGGFVRLGENQTRFARVLLVAATNQDMPRLIAEGRFRADLYHRLSELTIVVPPLNERREDIPDLAVHFLGQLYRIYRLADEPVDRVPVISPEAQKLLTQHNYTGNIRELRSILLRALLFRQALVISADDVRRAMTSGQHAHVSEEADQNPLRHIPAALQSGRGDFWSLIHKPFTENQMTRDTVRALIEETRRAGARNMPDIALALKACNPHSKDGEEQRRFFKFKNFLYKTVKI